MLVLTMSFPLFVHTQTLTGALGAYPFCGNANDIVGTNNGQIVGATLTADRFGSANSAYYFNGQPNCYINLGTSSLLKPLKGSISVWARPDGFSSLGSGYLLNPIILTKNQPGNNCYEGYAIGLVTAYGPIQFHATITQPFCLQCNGIYGVVQYQNWYHIVLTWNNDSLKLYVNGTLQQALYKGFTNSYLATDSIMVGNSANVQNNRFFYGAIDDLVIYGHTLTYSEVTALYNNTNLCTLGLEEQEQSDSPLLYPNPAHGSFTIAFDDPKAPKNISICDLTGRTVYQSSGIVGATLLVDTKDFSSGLYFVSVSYADRVRILKLICE